MAGRAPLAGVRVADFTWVWAGPFCTLQLAHLGAEVIRVETATRPCVTRLLPPFADFEPGPNRSGYFNQYNQGKKSIALDLKRPEAIEAAQRLCAASDVVVENFAAGVMERMGQGQYIDLSQWETSMAVLPEAICGWTMNGAAPERDGNRDAHMAPHGVFRAAGEDRWVALAVEDDAAWTRFAAAIGRPELAS